MSKVTDHLREHHIYNEHTFATAVRNRGGVGVFISFLAATTGRASESAKFQVIDPGKRTDPDAFWRDNGHKTFMPYSHNGDKAQTRVAAVAWAAEYTGTEVDQWVPGPFRGSVVLKSDRALGLAILKETVSA